MSSLFAPAFNLAVLIAIIFWKAGGPIKAFIRSRHETVRDEVVRSASLLKSAQAKFDEFTAKLKAIDAEVAALKEQARMDAQAMGVRIAADAKRLAGVIVSDARAAAEGQVNELRSQLSAELALRVLDSAERQLRTRLTGDDRQRIRKEFSQQLERGL